MAVAKKVVETKVEEQVETPKVKTVEKKFTKKAIIDSRKFINSKTLLKVLLRDDEMYSITEVNKILEEYLKKEVK